MYFLYSVHTTSTVSPILSMSKGFESTQGRGTSGLGTPTPPWKTCTTRLGTHDFIWGSVYPFILHLPLLAKRYKRCSLANDVIHGAWLQECVACCQSLKRRWLSERTISFHVLFLPETVMNLIAHQYKSVKHCL